MTMAHTFEMGPIRPPSEACSLLLRVTRNCPWNRCAFCNTYRDEKFSRRTVDEVKRDIDAMKVLADRILEASARAGHHGAITMESIDEARMGDDTPVEYYRQVGYWLHHGLKTAFLQDANSLIMNSGDLAGILRHLKDAFPSIERITSYARSKTVAKKTLEELKDLKAAGLSRLHIGMESGCDSVLAMVDKGVSSGEHIEAGQKAIAAGFDLSEYYMPGLGGMEYSESNAIETARVMNAINPTFIRIRSTVPIPGTPLHALMEERKWTPLTEDLKVDELRVFIEHLDGITSFIASDHMMNLIEDIEGRLPDDRDGLLGVIAAYRSMDTESRENFIVGRRIGRYRYLSDYEPDAQVQEITRKLKEQFGSIDLAVLELLKNFI